MFTLLAASEEVWGLYPKGPQTLASNPRRDSGVDLVLPEACEVPGGATVMLDLGVRAVYLCPEPHAFFLLARSSLATKTPLMLANGVGLIDLGYRGPIKATVRNKSSDAFRGEKGQALFQLVAADLSPAEYEVLSPSDPRAALHFGEGETLRGSGGFGSTGTGGSASLTAPEALLAEPPEGAR